MLNEIEKMDLSEYDKIFVCTDNVEKVVRILLERGARKETLLGELEVYNLLPNAEKMEYNKHCARCRAPYLENKHNIEVGDFTYGRPTVLLFEQDDVKVKIGKFCCHNYRRRRTSFRLGFNLSV